MSIRKWLFGDHRCNHSQCVDKQLYEKARKEEKELRERCSIFCQEIVMLRDHIEKITPTKEAAEKERNLAFDQVLRYADKLNKLEEQFKTMLELGLRAFSSKKQKHLKSFEEYLKTRLSEQEIASVKQQAQQEVDRMETETKSVDS